jgi:hypothetical protein
MTLNGYKYPVALCKGKAGKYTDYSTQTGITATNQTDYHHSTPSTTTTSSHHHDPPSPLNYSQESPSSQEESTPVVEEHFCSNDEEEKEEEDSLHSNNSIPTISFWNQFLALTQDLDAFSRAREWHTFHSPRNLVLALAGEVGELAELVQWQGDEDENEKEQGNKNENEEKDQNSRSMRKVSGSVKKDQNDDNDDTDEENQMSATAAAAVSDEQIPSNQATTTTNITNNNNISTSSSSITTTPPTVAASSSSSYYPKSFVFFFGSSTTTSGIGSLSSLFRGSSRVWKSMLDYFSSSSSFGFVVGGGWNVWINQNLWKTNKTWRRRSIITTPVMENENETKTATTEEIIKEEYDAKREKIIIQLGQELADVAIYAMRIATVCGVVEPLLKLQQQEQQQEEQLLQQQQQQPRSGLPSQPHDKQDTLLLMTMDGDNDNDNDDKEEEGITDNHNDSICRTLEFH